MIGILVLGFVLGIGNVDLCKVSVCFFEELSLEIEIDIKRLLCGF